jgi:peptidyl-prolyl cis-trans isomerase C
MMILTRTFRYLSLLLLVLLFAAGCNSELTSEVQSFIQINDRQLSKAEFDAAFAGMLQSDQPLSDEERLGLQRSFLVQLIDRELIFLEARRLAIDVTPEELTAALQGYFDDYPDDSFKAMLQERGMTMASWQAELKESLIMEKLLHETVYARVTVVDVEVETYYKDNREDFDRPAQVRARQIVVADEAEGRRVLGLLRQGQSFETVARKHSLSPDAQQGGDLGFFGRGQMPAEFDDAVFALPVGRLSDLVKSEYGFHIFLVEKKRAAARLSQKEADREIRRILESHKQEEAYQGWLQDLRSRATIEVDWNQLEK